MIKLSYGEIKPHKPQEKHPTIEGAKLAVMKEIAVMQYGNEVGDIAETYITEHEQN